MSLFPKKVEYPFKSDAKDNFKSDLNNQSVQTETHLETRFFAFRLSKTHLDQI